MKTAIKGATLKVITQVPDLTLLREILNHAATGAVEVSNDSITCEAADLDAVRVILAELGIEVSEEVNASEEPGAPEGNANPAEGGPASAPEGNAPPAPGAVEAAAAAAAAVTAAAGAAPAAGAIVRASEDGAVTEEQLFQTAGDALDNAEAVSGVLQASGQDAHWLIVASGNPIARISLSAQHNPGKIDAFFRTNAYWDTVLQAFNRHGAATALKRLNASVYTSKAVTAAAQPDVQGAVTAALSRYRQSLSMAFTAANKNLMQNQLKAAAYTALADKVEDPAAVVEEMFANAENFLQDLDGQAQEYSNMDDSALAATQKMLRAMTAQAPGSVVPAKSVRAQNMTRALVAGNNELATDGLDGAPGAEPLTPEDGSEGTIGGVSRASIRASLARH